MSAPDDDTAAEYAAQYARLTDDGRAPLARRERVMNVLVETAVACSVTNDGLAAAVRAILAAERAAVEARHDARDGLS